MRLQVENHKRIPSKGNSRGIVCTFIEWDIVAGFVDKSIFGVPVDEIGKTVFLTREGAEKALEAKRDGSTSM